MVLVAETKVVNRPVKKDGNIYDSFWIYLPKEIASDSQFPFAEGQPVKIKIDVKRNRLIISEA